MSQLIINGKLFVAFICLFILASCSNYGTKVTFPDHKGEVYYKGDGVTEADAKAVGKFLESQQFFLKDDKKRSVQISKDSGRVKARFVVDEKALATIPNVDESFALMGALMSKEVFNNTPVDVVFTDEFFKDIKTIPYKAGALAAVNVREEINQMQKKEYNKNTLYYTKDIPNEEADTISAYLVKNGFFTKDGNNDLIVAKNPGNGFHVSFLIKASFANEEGLQKADNFGKEMKRDLFANVPLEFEVLNENLESVKTFNY
ncbi:MAG: hypothetical protein ABI863_02045 [Ginsengibacter sp.]